MSIATYFAGLFYQPLYASVDVMLIYWAARAEAIQADWELEQFRKSNEFWRAVNWGEFVTELIEND